MKTYKLILGLAGISLLGTVSSCVSDKEFLTEKPKAELTVENAYQTSDQVLNTLLTGYYEFEELYFPGMFGQGLMYNTSTGTDMTDNKYQLGIGSHMSNFSAAWSADMSLTKSLWDKFYKVISYSNLSLSKIDDVEWESDDAKNRVAAEAKFLRGLSYLRLGELFGGVPMVLEYSETPNYAYDRASRSETYAAAISDLKEAYEVLPWDVKAEYGRAGKGAAGMYLAEAYLADGVENSNNAEFTSAASVAREVIEHHPLMTQRFGVRLPGASGSVNGIPNADEDGNVMSDLFVNQNITSSSNTEAIWVMVSAPDYASYAAYGGRRQCTLGFTPALQDYNWAAEYVHDGAASGPWKSFSSKYGGQMSPASHGGTGWAQSTPTWYASYTMWDAEHNNNTKEDLRYVEDVTVKTEYMCCDENHPLYEQKVGWNHIDHSTPELAGIYFPIWYKETPFDAWDYDASEPASWFGQYVYFYRSRYAARSAEVYFLLAEALLRSGDTAGATEAVNTVRARSNANPFSTVTIDTILDERGRELLYEEFRWATFLRMKPDEWKHRIYDYGMYSARSGAEIYPNIRRWSEETGEIKFNLFPIPQTYIDLNTGSDGLYQNDGWN
jgi:starch-binding outer membrane protein, SusD/RagB family